MPRGSPARSQRLAAYAVVVWKERCVMRDGCVRECAKQPLVLTLNLIGLAACMIALN